MGNLSLSEDAFVFGDGVMKKETKHAKMLLAWRKALVAKPIDIEVLLPLLPKGWVAMDAVNLKLAENWETSLMECGV